MSRRAKQLPYPKDQEGKPLCRWCSGPVAPPRRHWCSDKCVAEYQDQHDWPHIKRKVFERDKGLCAGCGCDTEQIRRILNHAFRYDRADERKYLLRWNERGLFEKRIGFNEDRSYWEADHILEVVRGGTNALDNLQTLCVVCHKEKTKRLAGERAKERRDAKRGLFNQEAM